MQKRNLNEYNKFLDAIISIIRKHDGLPCPTDEVFASILNSSRKRVNNALRSLVKTRRIVKIEKNSTRDFRCVLSGKQTASPQLKSSQKHRIGRVRDEFTGKAHFLKWKGDMPADLWFGSDEHYDSHGRRLNEYGQHFER